MRVLVLDEAVPWPTDSGKRIRTYELLRRLSREHEITLVAPEEAPTPPEAKDAMAAAGIALETVPRRPLVKHGARFAWDLARNLVHAEPYMAMAHGLAAVRDRVGALAQERKADLVHVEWTPLAVNVPEGLGLPVVVSAHNVEADIWARYRAAAPWGPRRAYIAIQHRKVARLEQRLFRAADAVLAVSEDDARTIRGLAPGVEVRVVPNGVDGSRFAPDPAARVDPDELVFVGSLDWRPNQDGVLWFLDEAWGVLRAARPGLQLTVVGRAPPAGFAARCAAAPGVRVAGSVPDVRPYLARAAALIVPLRVGGGSRLKICEALSMGRPVVSTTVGAEGLDVGDGVVLADDAAGLVRAILATLASPGDAAAQAARGRARILATNEWGTIAPLQSAAWRAAAPRKGPS